MIYKLFIVMSFTFQTDAGLDNRALLIQSKNVYTSKQACEDSAIKVINLMSENPQVKALKDRAAAGSAGWLCDSRQTF